MYVLGIETSCDETSASVVKNGASVLSNEIASSLSFHKKYGGIVPEIAFRKQLETIAPVVESSLADAGITLKDIGLISVTDGPGLLGSLVVGISFAKALSLSTGIPLLGVNHLQSHIFASFLEKNKPEFPFIALIISGGHSSLFYVKDFDKIEIIGFTKDDACGEAFDKVAKMLGLGYPGGPVIEQKGKQGNAESVRFSCLNKHDHLGFSFSGIKTAVLYHIRDNQPRKSALNPRFVRDVSASFQKAVIDTLIKKAFAACKHKRTPNLVIGGGVAANNKLREQFFSSASGRGVKVFFPSLKYCMDNAGMVACLGYYLFKKGYRSDLSLNVKFDK